MVVPGKTAFVAVVVDGMFIEDREVDCDIDEAAVEFASDVVGAVL